MGWSPLPLTRKFARSPNRGRFPPLHRPPPQAPAQASAPHRHHSVTTPPPGPQSQRFGRGYMRCHALGCSAMRGGNSLTCPSCNAGRNPNGAAAMRKRAASFAARGLARSHSPAALRPVPAPPRALRLQSAVRRPVPVVRCDSVAPRAFKSAPSSSPRCRGGSC